MIRIWEFFSNIWIGDYGFNIAPPCHWKIPTDFKSYSVATSVICGGGTSIIVFIEKTKHGGPQHSLFWHRVQPAAMRIPFTVHQWRKKNTAIQSRSRCRTVYKSLTCAGFRARVSGGLLYHRPSSKEAPPVSSTSLISSHVCGGAGTVEFWGGKKRRRAQLEPAPIFPPSKSKIWT